MGTILTNYGDAGYDHEGYPAQLLDDGSITGTYSAETEPHMIGQVVAACDCGWRGTTRYPCPEPFDEQAENLALAEWEHLHARPVLEACRTKRWTSLAAHLRALADRMTANPLHTTAGREQAELIEGILSALDRLAAKTRELQGERDAW